MSATADLTLAAARLTSDLTLDASSLSGDLVTEITVAAFIGYIYRRPDGTSKYVRPDGASNFKRP